MDRLDNGEAAYSSKWRRRRSRWLKENPLCVYCTKQGHITAACVVDHIKPHRGDPVLFWDEDNWQSLCTPCHAIVKQCEELHGFNNLIGLDGWPIDENHPVNKKDNKR